MADKTSSLSNEDQRVVRVGYYKLHKKPLPQEIFADLRPDEIKSYHSAGVASEKRDIYLKYLGYGVVALLIVGVIGYSYINNNRTKEHYSQIVPVDTCKLIIDRLDLFRSDIHATSYQPQDLTTKFEGNTVSTCKFFLNGEDDDMRYRAFITATVTKTPKKQVDNSKSQDVSLVTDTPYNLFGWDAVKNYYKVNVNGAIDPAETNMDNELRDATSKLIVILTGTAITDELPVNASVSDL